MRTPSIRIGQLDYSITEVPDLQREEDEAFLFGHIHLDTQLIEINAGLANTVKQVALLHEIIHGMLFQGGVMLDYDTEEKVCIRLSFALLELIRQNPQLITELQNVE